MQNWKSNGHESLRLFFKCMRVITEHSKLKKSDIFHCLINHASTQSILRQSVLTHTALSDSHDFCFSLQFEKGIQVKNPDQHRILQFAVHLYSI